MYWDGVNFTQASLSLISIYIIHRMYTYIYNVYLYMHTWAVWRKFAISCNLMITNVMAVALCILVPLNSRCCRKYLWAITSVYLWHMGVNCSMNAFSLFKCLDFYKYQTLNYNIYTSLVKTYITIKFNYFILFYNACQ